MERLILKLTTHLLFAPLAGATLLLGQTALADTMLPAPYISRALDAVLIPINADVIDMFALYPEDTGVLVLAVQDGGVAAANGIEPGDVISFVSGHAIYEPIDLDTLVYYWISTGVYDFYFDGYRGDGAMTYDSTISYDSYMEVIEVSSVETWSSYTSESFSYSEFYAEYSSEISESYESSETTIEETASSDAFVAELDATADESMSDETTTDAATTDETMADDGSMDDGSGDVVDDGSADTVDDGSGDVVDDGSADTVDDGSGDVVDDGSADTVDDGSGDVVDDGGDTGGDTGGDEVSE